MGNIVSLREKVDPIMNERGYTMVGQLGQNTLVYQSNVNSKIRIEVNLDDWYRFCGIIDSKTPSVAIIVGFKFLSNLLPNILDTETFKICEEAFMTNYNSVVNS